jgi:hypothetical protein
LQFENFWGKRKGKNNVFGHKVGQKKKKKNNQLQLNHYQLAL